MTPVLRVAGLTKRYGDRTVVDDVSFALAEGEVVAFLGRNGAGKSTVIKLLCNLVRPSAGEAWLDGRPMLSPGPGWRGAPAEHRRGLGAVVEAPRFYPQLSGRRNLEWVARLQGVPAAAAAEMLERVGLAGHAAQPFGHYSLGMKQRLGLAAAFLHRPRLVILDEPTGGLDPVGYAQIHELIRGLVRERRSSVLLCTHQLAEAAALCGRALVIDGGRIVLSQELGASESLATVQRLFDRLAAEGAA